jgi:predicted DNA-binding transcriptional regulator YafY
MPADYSRIQRLLQIVTLIQSGGQWNVPRLAQETGCSERSIYRDIRVLQNASVPVSYDDEKKTYKVSGDFFLPPVQLKADEALALIAMAEQVGGAEQVPHLKPALTGAQKLRSQLSPSVRRQLEKADGKVSIKLARANAPESTAGSFEKVHHAVENRLTLDVAYDSAASQASGKAPSGGGKFLLDPYALMFNQRAWYVVGYSHKHKEVRNFKLSRFTRLIGTAHGFEPQKGWTLEKHLGNAWRMMRGKPTVEVELEFQPEFADTIEETQWHKTQKTEILDNGALRFTATVDGIEEIVWWVLSMGPGCRVIRPPALVERVRELAGRVVSQYAEANTGGDERVRRAAHEET